MPATNEREVEAKFQVAPDQLPLLDLPTLALDGYTTKSIGTLTHTDTYWDSVSYDLLRHGFAFRVRLDGNLQEVGIKSIAAPRKGAVQNRKEVSISLPADAEPHDPATWSAVVKRQVASYDVKLDDLRPLVVIRQQRHKTIICSTNTGNALAEWSLDQVWIDTHGNSIATDEWNAHKCDADHNTSSTAHFYELELELLTPKNESQSDEDVETLFAQLVAQV